MVSPTAPTRSARSGKTSAPTPAATVRSADCAGESGRWPGYRGAEEEEEEEEGGWGGRAAEDAREDDAREEEVVRSSGEEEEEEEEGAEEEEEHARDAATRDEASPGPPTRSERRNCMVV